MNRQVTMGKGDCAVSFPKTKDNNRKCISFLTYDLNKKAREKFSEEEMEEIQKYREYLVKIGQEPYNCAIIFENNDAIDHLIEMLKELKEREI